MNESQTGCCPTCKMQSLDKKEVHFDNKLFIKAHVTHFCNIPLNLKSVIVRNVGKVSQGTLPQEPVILRDEKSFWGSDIYIAVNKNVPGAEMAVLSGTFSAQVFEGPYKNIRQWLKQTVEHVREKGKNKKKIYHFYSICPRCAKFYGKNYAVLAQV